MPQRPAPWPAGSVATAYHPPSLAGSLTSSPATTLPARPSWRERGALRLSALLAAGVGALALLGQQAEPAARAVPPADAPNGALTIGAVIALTGNANLYGQDQRVGLSLARQWAQSRPRQPGEPPLRPLHFQLQDGGSDEATAIAGFNLLIRQGVLALIGPTLSQQAFAADPIAQRRGVPVVAPSNTARGIPQIGSFISRVSAQSSVIAPLSISEALRRDPRIRRVAVFYSQDDAFSTSETAIFQRTLRARGLTPVSVQRTQLADNDFQIPITAALQADPQLVVISIQAVGGGNLVRQLRELGYRGPIVVGNGMNTANIYPICQRWCDGILIAQAYSPELDTPINRRFRELLRRSSPDHAPSQITAQAFTAYQVLFEAVQRLQRRGGLQSVSLGQARKALMAELLAGTYDTPLGPIRFTPDGELVQGRFYVAEVRMDPGGRSGRFALVRETASGDGAQ
ncbi:ABC transporter substrate-binding protein [Cyanobium sp. FGCU-6]|nr:ABC transporter substrate-binding protein [Cyanobium sp. FGCU6]